MQEFLRRNFWVVHLVALGVGAYLLAGVVTEVAATAFLKAPPAPRDAAVAVTAPRAVKP